MQKVGAAANGYCVIQGRTELLLLSFEIYKIAIYVVGCNVEYWSVLEEIRR